MIQIKRLAELSALALCEQEIEQAEKDLMQMLEFTASLSGLPDSETKEERLDGCGEGILPCRSMARACILQNAPECVDGFFCVPNRKGDADV